MSNVNYYEVLGVDKYASDDVIKKAYRRLAKENHPDLNPGDDTAAERFKAISEAYDVLSDSVKRAQYDRTGTVSGNTNGSYTSPDIDYSDLGDAYSSFFSRGNDNARGRSVRGEDIKVRVSLTFEEALFGKTKSVFVEELDSLVNLKVPVGVMDGATLTMKGQGLAGKNGGAAGDIIFILSVQPHDFFKRDGNNILVDTEVSFTQAALGAELRLPTLDGDVMYSLPKGTQPGTTFRLRGLGAPKKDGSGRGDQYVTIRVKVPTNLTPEQESLLRRFEEIGKFVNSNSGVNKMNLK